MATAGFSNAAITQTIQYTFNTLASGGTVVSDQQAVTNFGGSVSFTQGTAADQATKRWERAITFSISTPVVLDLTSLTGGTGDTSFAGVTAIGLQHTAGTLKMIVGNNASNDFLGPLGGTTPTIDIQPGGTLILQNRAAGGWTVDGTHKSIKLNPGAATCTLYVVILGV